jgi:hypothetical protein
MAAAAERNARAARDTAVRHEGSQAFVASAVRGAHHSERCLAAEVAAPGKAIRCVRRGGSNFRGSILRTLYSTIRHLPRMPLGAFEESAMETKPSPRCPNCGQTLRRMRLISDLYRLPDLQVFECPGCDISLIEGAEDLE